MKISSIVLGIYATNCYVVQGDGAKSCVLIDPADSGKALVSELNRLGLSPEAVLLTHGHYDHILAVPELQAAFPQLPVYCHYLDVPEAKVELDMGQKYPTVSAFANVVPLKGGETLHLAGLSFQVLHTPGHTKGSVTYILPEVLFTGDTLFQGSIGRTDFPGGNMEEMERSLKLLKELPGDYRVLPGHDAETTLEAERRHNPYMSWL